jgi:hypothetical protein
VGQIYSDDSDRKWVKFQPTLTDIHAATGSDELYVQMATEIAEHFAARKVFKLKTPT